MKLRLSHPAKVDRDGILYCGPTMTITERQWIYEAGIGYFFDERFNLMADQDVTLIYSNMGGFGCACKACGCPIEKLWKNRGNKHYWMKHFQVPDLKAYLENEEIRKMCGVNLDIMKRSHSSDPNKALGKFNINCWCKSCKKISKVISYNAWRAYFSKNSAEKIIADVKERLFDDHLRNSDYYKEYRKAHRKPYERFSDDEDSY